MPTTTKRWCSVRQMALLAVLAAACGAPDALAPREARAPTDERDALTRFQQAARAGANPHIRVFKVANGRRERVRASAFDKALRYDVAAVRRGSTPNVLPFPGEATNGRDISRGDAFSSLAEGGLSISGATVVQSDQDGRFSILSKLSVVSTTSPLASQRIRVTANLSTGFSQPFEHEAGGSPSPFLAIDYVSLIAGGCVTANASFSATNREGASSQSASGDGACFTPKNCETTVLDPDAPPSGDDGISPGDPTHCDGAPGGGESTPGGDPACHTEYMIIEIDWGEGWQTWWEGYVSVCEY